MSELLTMPKAVQKWAEYEDSDDWNHLSREDADRLLSPFVGALRVKARFDEGTGRLIEVRGWWPVENGLVRPVSRKQLTRSWKVETKGPAVPLPADPLLARMEEYRRLNADRLATRPTAPEPTEPA